MTLQIAIKQLEGRDHYVVPMVMLTEGVFAGSSGPVYYPPSELAASVPYWNAKPVVVYHPSMYGSGWAGNPDVFNQQKVGTIFNTRFDGKRRLLADAWVDVQRVKHVDPRVEQAIVSRKTLELSTGLVFDFAGTGGTHNGRDYKAAAHNLKPDHLAILPDKLGACSIADGAGFVRNDDAVCGVVSTVAAVAAYGDPTASAALVFDERPPVMPSLW